MPTSFSVYFPTPTPQDFSLIPFNTGDRDLGFQVSGDALSLTLAPEERVKWMLKPSGLALTDTQMSGILRGQTTDDRDAGQFFAYLENTTRTEQDFSLPSFRFPANWENTQFTLSWLRWIPATTYNTFGKNANGVYSYPHNIDPSEVTISGRVSGDIEQSVNYTVFYSGLTNEGSIDYAGGNHQPYMFKVQYSYPDYVNSPYTIYASGFNGWEFYPSGVMTSSGISFDLPFYDQRNQQNNIPATYTFFMNYQCADPSGITSTPLQVVLNHAFIRDNFYADLTSLAVSQPKDEDLHEVDSINIPDDIISRRRLAIGIEDIKSVERVFEKDGVYISNAYNLDFSIYTFSLKVNEVIPDYDGIDKWTTVKYYVSFNNGEWLRISPIERDTESDAGVTIPKLFVFDAIENEDDESLIQYVNVDGLVNNFRIKIVIDLSALQDTVFVPPEIRNYKCMIFDKEHFANFEA